MFVNPTEGRVLSNQTQVSNRKELGVLKDSDRSSEPPEERLTIDNLNLQCFISLSESWNATDTLFVFIIVLISHPAGAPLPAGLWAAQLDVTTQLKQSLDFMAFLISFICVKFFFFFLLLSLIFTVFFLLPTLCVCAGAGAKSLDSQNGFAFEDSKNYGKTSTVNIYQQLTSLRGKQHRCARPLPAAAIVSWAITLKLMSVSKLWWAEGRGTFAERLLCCPWRCLFCLTTSFFCGWKSGGSIMMQIWHHFHLWELRGLGCLAFGKFLHCEDCFSSTLNWMLLLWCDHEHTAWSGAFHRKEQKLTACLWLFRDCQGPSLFANL